ncbi:stage II sporulation protein E [Streptomyces sp. Amel2xB2]|uniref:PP2C family protein-serine/threonine phosphatase n=1 Tax=Streptomyces sp. Amel2xB2 TaxID=1305829 RepID=UPI000DBFD569|nr:PP2C family protein-serine/threonine phosphatase [Streptomyces sp. Amel2xB2]RAJ70368.1 stage II sporulation protein E [Streptomyces sp. Amel2xB2]
MARAASSRAEMLGEIIAASHLVTLTQLPTVVSEEARHHGWPEVLMYLADLRQTVLTLMPGENSEDLRESGEVPTEFPIDGTVPGRAFQLGEILPTSAGGGQWWVPVLDGTERIGMMRVTTGEDGAQTKQELRDLAGLVALLLVTKRGTSDSYARLVRRRRMNVAAEMEWRLMPPRTSATDRALVSAVMEPAYQVSGDAFDYAFTGDVVHLSVFDAMGHDTAAGLTANLAVAACRNHRRQGHTLVETANGVEKALVEQFEDNRYATGVLADLDVNTGELSWISRGHFPPVVIRGGRSAVQLGCTPAPPMGTGLGITPGLCHDQLEPGDRLLLYTDGITEARMPGGEEFGLDRFTDFLIRHHADGLPVPETLRRFIAHHLEYHGGRLSDDATVLVLEWHGPVPYAPGEVEALVGLPARSAPARMERPTKRGAPGRRGRGAAGKTAGKTGGAPGGTTGTPTGTTAGSSTGAAEDDDSGGTTDDGTGGPARRTASGGASRAGGPALHPPRRRPPIRG